MGGYPRDLEAQGCDDVVKSLKYKLQKQDCGVHVPLTVGVVMHRFREPEAAARGPSPWTQGGWAAPLVAVG